MLTVFQNLHSVWVVEFKTSIHKQCYGKDVTVQSNNIKLNYIDNPETSALTTSLSLLHKYLNSAQIVHHWLHLIHLRRWKPLFRKETKVFASSYLLLRCCFFLSLKYSLYSSVTLTRWSVTDLLGMSELISCCPTTSFSFFWPAGAAVCRQKCHCRVSSALTEIQI